MSNITMEDEQFQDNQVDPNIEEISSYFSELDINDNDEYMDLDAN